MSRQLNPAQIWSQVPLANRTASIVRSIQKGSIAFSGTNVVTGTATITALTAVTKAMVLHTGGSQSGAAEGASTNVVITNTTTITATTTNDNGSGRTYTTGFVVIEFY